MLFLDVTGACESPAQTGVPRVIRELYAALRERTEVTPLHWNRRIKSYCRLSRRNRLYLENPSLFLTTPLAEPRQHLYPRPWSRLVRLLIDFQHRLDLTRRLSKTDCLLTPAAFLDNRIHLLREMKEATGMRHIAILHDLLPLTLPEFTGPRPKSRFQFYAGALAGCDHVICVSHQTRAELEEFWRESKIPAAPLSVESWPITPFETGPAPPNFEARSILCVSSFETRKNHLGLLDAVERLFTEIGPRFELVLIGHTTRHWGKRVISRMEELKRKGARIRWLAHVSEERLHRAYRESGFTVFPSLAEGYGLPILESLAHGRPCICGGNGALGEIAAGGGCLIVDQKSPDELCAAMKRLIDDEPAYNALQKAASNRSFRSWSSYADDLIQGVLNNTLTPEKKHRAARSPSPSPLP